jgi:hypothetical protein
VEDRQPTGLWIELLRGADPSKRAAALSEAGLRVSTWTPDPYPERIPQRIDDCIAMLVSETTDTDVPALYAEIEPAEPSSTVIPLRRYPRPSQGICTGEETNGLLLVLITPRDDAQAQVLRDWADFVHLRHIAAARVPGYTMITAYERIDMGSLTTLSGRRDARPRYCHFYEMTTHDPRGSFDAMVPAVSKEIGEPGTPSFDEWAAHPALRIDYVNTFRRV